MLYHNLYYYFNKFFLRTSAFNVSIWCSIILLFALASLNRYTEKLILLKSETVSCHLIGTRNDTVSCNNTVFNHLYNCQGITIEKRTKYLGNTIIFNKQTFLYQSILNTEIKHDYIFLNIQ